MIVCADLHLRLDVPICRNETEEEWFRLQRKTVEAVMRAADDKGHCQDIYIAGDIFHRPLNSPRLVNMFLQALYCLDGDGKVCVLAGNHDLQARNPDYSGTSFGTILYSDNVDLLTSQDVVPYGQEKVRKGYLPLGQILFMHRYVVESPNDIIPGMDAITAHDLLALYPDYKLIVAGDNHSGFLYTENGRAVLVPGAMTRQSANAIDKMPFMYYIDDHLNIEPIALPDCEAILSREHLDKANEREGRMTAFIEALKERGEVTLDFEENVAMALLRNKLKGETETMVKELVYG
jgi:DNA repair exonuclease SbcCD nuclease subunit